MHANIHNPHQTIINSRSFIDERRLVGQIFCKIWARLQQVDFNPSWSSDGNCFDNAVVGQEAPKLEVGQMVAAHTDVPEDRMLIIIGTPLGNVVVFERYTAGQLDAFAINCTREFHRFVGRHLNRPLTADDMDHLLGDYTAMQVDKNIGIVLRDLVTTINEFTIEGASVV